MTEKQHADAGPSSAAMWMRCPASVTQSRGRERKSTFYAREGTAAHAVAEMILRGEEIPDAISVEGESIEVDEAMHAALDYYIQFAELLRHTATYFAIEQRVFLDAYFPNGAPEPVFGTADLIAYDATTGLLTVADLKFGRGYQVAAEGNPQARIYALGAIAALDQLGQPAPRVIRSVIVQPRGHGEMVRAEEITAEELRAWFEEELRPAIERIGAGDTTEVAGDHCRWCVRAGECRALHATALEATRMAFDDLAPPDHTSFSNEELSEILDKAELINAWVAKVRAEVSSRLDSGQKVPGWKLVAKRANRKWKDLDGVEEELLCAGFTSKEISVEPALLSPAQMEKLLKKSGLDPKMIEPFVSRESSGTTLVKEADARAAVDTSPASVFSVIEADALF